MQLKQLLQMNQKGGGPADIPAYAILLVVSAMVLGFGILVLASVQTTLVSSGFAAQNSTSWNAIGYGITGTSQLSQWLPLIALVIAAVIIISLILRGFGGSRM